MKYTYNNDNFFLPFSSRCRKTRAKYFCKNSYFLHRTFDPVLFLFHRYQIQGSLIFSLKNIDPSLKEEKVEEYIALDLTVYRFDQTEVQEVFEWVRAVFEETLESALWTKYVLSQTLGQAEEFFLLQGQISLGLAGWKLDSSGILTGN